MTRRHRIVRVVAVILLTLLLLGLAGRIPLSPRAAELVSGLAHSFGSEGVDDTMDLYMSAITLAAPVLSVAAVFMVDRLFRQRR